MDIKFIYEGLSKKLSFTFLTIIQFTIVFLCIYVAIDTLSKVNKATKELTEVFDNGYFYEMDESLCITDLGLMDDRYILEDFKELLKIKDYFDNNSKLDFLSINYTEILIDIDKGIANSSVMNPKESFNGKEYLRAEAYCTNKVYLENMNYDFIDGSFNEFEKIKDDGILPVILGSNYKDKCNVSDFIEIYNPFKGMAYKMKVIGILDEDSYIFQDGVGNDKMPLSNAILFPFDESILDAKSKDYNSIAIAKTSLENYLKSGFVKLEDKEMDSAVNNYLLSNKFKFQIKDINESIKEYKEEVYTVAKPIIYTVTIIILFTIISVIVVMSNSINKSKQEFGINIMLGATMRDIRLRVLGEVIGLFILSSIISLILINLVSFVTYSTVNFVITIGIISIVITFIARVLLNKLNKCSVNDLVRRKE